MLDKIKSYWEYAQSLLDIDGDVVMLFFTGAIILRLIMVRYGWPQLNLHESTVYASAIGCFAYSNRGGGKQS